MHLPDLRNSPTEEISLEHCAVLLEKLRDNANLPDGEKVFGEIIDDIDLSDMCELLQATFGPEEFDRLFATDIGKGVLIGVYMNELFNDIMGDFNERDEE